MKYRSEVHMKYRSEARMKYRSEAHTIYRSEVQLPRFGARVAAWQRLGANTSYLRCSWYVCSHEYNVCSYESDVCSFEYDVCSDEYVYVRGMCVRMNMFYVHVHVHAFYVRMHTCLFSLFLSLIYTLTDVAAAHIAAAEYSTVLSRFVCVCVFVCVWVFVCV